jgi:hypothetical protein
MGGFVWLTSICLTGRKRFSTVLDILRAAAYELRDPIQRENIRTSPYWGTGLVGCQQRLRLAKHRVVDHFAEE